MAHYSPLRYPGGKAKMYKQTVKILEDNNLIGCTYIEPFAGGANLALNLLINGKVKEIVLNDYDLAIYAVWYSVLNYTEEFIDMISEVNVTVEERNNQKVIYENEKKDLLKLGFATFFLNRTNRSGIIKAGPIGGINQNSKYRIDCRFNKANLIARIRKISAFKERITIFNEDAKIFLDREFEPNCFLFIDPPYYNKGAELYENSFTHAEHVLVSEKVNELIVPWILTYDNVGEIIEMYSFCESKNYNLSYTVQQKRIGSEIMFYKNNLIVEF